MFYSFPITNYLLQILIEMAEIHYMTQEGLDKLKKDLAEALAQRPVISAAIAEAREKGDLSENAEYDAAREAQGLLEVKIAKLKVCSCLW